MRGSSLERCTNILGLYHGTGELYPISISLYVLLFLLFNLDSALYYTVGGYRTVAHCVIKTIRTQPRLLQVILNYGLLYIVYTKVPTNLL